MAPKRGTRIGRGAAAVLALVVLTSWIPGSARASGQSFPVWLEELKREAREKGVSARTLERALHGVKPLPKVIALDRRQPEGKMSFAHYLSRTITPARVEMGRKKLTQHRALLGEIARQYGVQPRFIVALWAIETDFGRNTGGFRVVDALATLAHDGRRSAYFRGELLDALRILDRGDIAADAMHGSWAGAMGQCQFMPSSFLRYAVDHDGDGRRDIWRTQGDVFASAANYLKTVGWDASQTWGREVRLPEGYAGGTGLESRLPLAQWSAAGFRRVDGGELPQANVEASLVLPDGRGGRAFLVYDNYRTIMHWNRSLYFATTVGLLADRIGGEDMLR